MKKETIKIKGMFCPRCEERIASALQKINGVESAEASFRRGDATVIFDPEKTGISQLREAILSEGYEPEEKGACLQIASILIILLALYIIARRLGWMNIFNLFPSIENTMELGMLFLTV